MGLILYTIWLYTQQLAIVPEGQGSLNMLMLVLILLLGFYFLILVAQPQFAPNNRWMLAVIGVLVIITAESMLQDDASNHIYLQDILKIIGALLVITGPMKLLVTKESQHKKFMQEVEIIEV